MSVPALWTSRVPSGGLQTAQAAAVDAQARAGLVQALDARAERLDGRQRRERVGIGAEARDLGRALGDRADQQRAVRDRLVPGHGQLADECGGGRHLEPIGSGRGAHVASASTGAASAP